MNFKLKRTFLGMGFIGGLGVVLFGLFSLSIELMGNVDRTTQVVADLALTMDRNLKSNCAVNWETQKVRIYKDGRVERVLKSRSDACSKNQAQGDQKTEQFWIDPDKMGDVEDLLQAALGQAKERIKTLPTEKTGSTALEYKKRSLYIGLVERLDETQLDKVVYDQSEHSLQAGQQLMTELEKYFQETI